MIGRSAGIRIARQCSIGAIGLLASGAVNEKSDNSGVFLTVSPVAIALTKDGSSADGNCSHFDVLMSGKIAQAWMSTKSLGNARLALAHGSTCPARSDPRWAELLLLPDQIGRQTVALSLDAGDFPDGESKGQLFVANSASELASTEVIVKKSAAFELWPEFKWFVGFVVPSLLAFLFARWTVSRTERRAEKNSLVLFRTTNRTKVDALVRDIRTALATKYDHPGWQILQSIERDVLTVLPNNKKDRVISLAEADNVKKLITLLKHVFPSHKNQLQEAWDNRKQ